MWVRMAIWTRAGRVGTQMTDVWEMLSWVVCPRTLTVKKAGTLSLSPGTCQSPRSPWSHHLQPSRRPCSLLPASRNEEVAWLSPSEPLPAFTSRPRADAPSSCVEAASGPLWEGLGAPEGEGSTSTKTGQPGCRGRSFQV